MYLHSLVSPLATLILAKLAVHGVSASDARLLRSCNWIGGYHLVLAMDWYMIMRLFSHNTPLTNITLDGTVIAAVAKNVDNFSFARVYAAGHDSEVPAFQPAAALQIFTQVIQ